MGFSELKQEILTVEDTMFLFLTMLNRRLFSFIVRIRNQLS